MNAKEGQLNRNQEQWQNTQNFVRRAVAEGAHEKLPVNQRNMVGVFTWTQGSLGDIGDEYGVTRQAIHAMLKNGIQDLRAHSSFKTRQEFPREKLGFRKPPSQANREWWSVSHGGTAIKIKNALLEGKSNRQIAKELNIRNLGAYRKTLSEWPVPIPYTNMSGAKRADMEKKLQDRTLRDDEVQATLDKVTLQFYRTHVSQGDPVIVPIQPIFTEQGVTLSFKDLGSLRWIFEKMGIPMGQVEVSGGKDKPKVSCHFIATIHKDRAVRAIHRALVE